MSDNPKDHFHPKTMPKDNYHSLRTKARKMCKWGTDEPVLVFIPAELSHTHEDRFDIKKIDKCIAPLVRALTNAGIYPIQSCCGHGDGEGRIDLYDGRTLIIQGEENER